MSSHEIQARANKVAAIVALVPRRFTASKVKAARVADRMALFTAEQRTRWASVAGVTAPSDLTWAHVVAAVRARYPRVHRHDFRDGDVCSICDRVRARPMLRAV